MATYAAHARIDGVRPRRAERRPSDETSVRRFTLDDEGSDGVQLDVTGDPADWDWGRLREIWSQTTFYLFDPSGWR